MLKEILMIALENYRLVTIKGGYVERSFCGCVGKTIDRQ